MTLFIVLLLLEQQAKTSETNVLWTWESGGSAIPLCSCFTRGDKGKDQRDRVIVKLFSVKFFIWHAIYSAQT